jgi:hypothetical protein
LRGKCGLGDMQLLRRARQVSFLGNPPEVIEVVKVELSHTNVLLYRIILSKVYILH